MSEKELKIAEQIAYLRNSQGMTQEQLAIELGYSKQTISNWETGIKVPRMGAIQKIADFFNVSTGFVVDGSPQKENNHNYMMFDTPVSAGTFDSLEPTTNTRDILLPDITLGKYAGDKDVFVILVNGESMNRVIPNGSLIAVKKLNSIDSLKNDDIVVVKYDNETTVKRFYNDKENERIIFRPDSNDNRFIDKVIPYSECDKLEIEGKVVIYIVELD